MLQNYKYQYSRLLVLAVHAAAFLAARLPFLEAFAVVFLAFGFRTLAAFFDSAPVVVLDWVDVLAVETLAVGATDSSLGEALAVLGAALRFGAFAFNFSLDFGFVGLQ